jgi:hypothetical protein
MRHADVQVVNNAPGQVAIELNIGQIAQALPEASAQCANPGEFRCHEFPGQLE